MPEKKNYRIDGKVFVWTTEDGAEVTIPMRVKLKLIRGMAGVELDADGMFGLLDALIPDQAEVLDEMDVNDFQAMFSSWQQEYEQLSGARLGE